MPLESLFAFAQFFLYLQCSGLEMTAEGTVMRSKKCMAGKYRLTLENKVKYIGDFSLVSPLLENVLALAHLTFYLQYRGLKMKD